MISFEKNVLDSVIPQDNIVLVNSQFIYRKVQRKYFWYYFFFLFPVSLIIYPKYLSNLKLQNISPPKVVQSLFASVP